MENFRFRLSRLQYCCSTLTCKSASLRECVDDVPVVLPVLPLRALPRLSLVAPPSRLAVLLLNGSSFSDSRLLRLMLEHQLKENKYIDNLFCRLSTPKYKIGCTLPNLGRANAPLGLLQLNVCSCSVSPSNLQDCPLLHYVLFSFYFHGEIMN